MASGAAPLQVELALYVNPRSAACLRVRAAIENVLEEYSRDNVSFEVLDVSLDTERAERDSVLFTPTLVKRRPEPPAWLIGDAGGELVATLLAASGVQKKR
jgi:circadian clock protein KaiB